MSQADDTRRCEECVSECERCPVPSPTTIRRDSTQPPAYDAYSEMFWWDNDWTLIDNTIGALEKKP